MIGRGRIARELLETEKNYPPLSVPKGIGRAAISRSLSGLNTPPGLTIRQPSGPQPPPLDPQLPLNDEELPERPEYTSAGDSIKVLTNFINVKFGATQVWQYHVTFNPPIDSKFLRFKLLEDQFNNPVWRFDGAILYTAEELPRKGYFDAVVQSSSSGEPVKISYMLTRTCSIETCIPLLNIIFKSVLSKLKYTRIGKNLYDPRRAVQIPRLKLEVWPGYITSVQEMDGGFMLQTNVSHKMLRTDTVMDMLIDIHKTDPVRFKTVSTKAIVGQVVLTRYNNKTYRVDDISWDMNPESCFEDRRGNKISYISYYKNQYEINIIDTLQPLLIHRIKPKRGQQETEERLIYLIPELCAMTGLHDSLKDNMMMRKDIAAHTRLDPRERLKSLRGFITKVNECESAREELEKWNISISDESLNEITARKLYEEDIILGDGRVAKAGATADFSHVTSTSKPITSIAIDQWVLIHTLRDTPRAGDLVRSMMEVSRSLGMTVSQPTTLPLRDDRPETYLHAISKYATSDTKLIVTIVPTERDDRYNAIKRKCYIDSPVANQVIKSKTLMNPSRLRSVVQKIMLQINAKLGGELWRLKIPLEKVMIVGVDTYHDPSSRNLSYTGFVSTINQQFTKFFSTCHQEDSGQEFSSSLQNMMISAIRNYQQVNEGGLPHRIIVFRDGVSEGQLSVVKSYEVSQLLDAFKHFQPPGTNEAFKPQLVVVVVQKRIRTRMFFSESGRIKNPPPGTVLDHTITSHNLYDFFLVSQHVSKGTVTPSRYIVVHNNSTLKPEHVQKLAYKLTHMYWNWPGTIRVPSVCLYAHKVAYMHGQHLHRQANPALQNKLYYL